MADINRPNAIVLIKDLQAPADISKVLKNLSAYNYAYAFKHREKTIKIGMSAANSRMRGERVYRQIANLPGWEYIPASDAGKDIIEAVRMFERQENVVVHKDECTVEIWLSNNALLDESILLDQYYSIHKCLPPGNPKDTRIKNRVCEKVLTDLFEFE